MAEPRPVLASGPSLTARQAQVSAFNAAHPVGSPILVWVGRYRDGQPIATEVAAPARCAGRTGPMVLVRDEGWIALTHIFHRRGRADRRELFLDASRIAVERAELRLDPSVAQDLRIAAGRRGITAGELACLIVEVVVRHSLIDAVLEDGAQTRARRRYREAA